jgi:hypothetical protein
MPVLDMNLRNLRAIAVPSTTENFALRYQLTGSLIRAAIFTIILNDNSEVKIGVDIFDFPRIRDIENLSSRNDVLFLRVIERNLITKKGFNPQQGYVYDYQFPFADFVRRIYSLNFYESQVLLYVKAEEYGGMEATGQEGVKDVELELAAYGAYQTERAQAEAAQAEAAQAARAYVAAEEAEATEAALSEALGTQSPEFQANEIAQIPKLFRDLVEFKKSPYGYYFVALYGTNQSVYSLNILMGKPIFCFKNPKFQSPLPICYPDQVNLYTFQTPVAKSILENPLYGIKNLENPAATLTGIIQDFYTEQNDIKDPIHFSSLFLETVLTLFNFRVLGKSIYDLPSKGQNEFSPNEYTMGYLCLRQLFNGKLGNAFALIQNNDTGLWRAVDSNPYVGLSEEVTWNSQDLNELLLGDPWNAQILLKIEYPRDSLSYIQMTKFLGRNLRKTSQFDLITKAFYVNPEDATIISQKTRAFDSYESVFNINFVFDGEEYRYTADQGDISVGSLRYAKILLDRSRGRSSGGSSGGGLLERVGSAASEAVTRTSSAVSQAVGAAASGVLTLASQGVQGTLSAIGSLLPSRPALTRNQLQLDPYSFTREQLQEKAVSILEQVVYDQALLAYYESKDFNRQPNLFWEGYSDSYRAPEFNRLKKEILMLFNQIRNSEFGQSYLEQLYSTESLNNDTEINLSKYLWHIKYFHNLASPKDSEKFSVYPKIASEYPFMPFNESDFKVFLQNVPSNFYDNGEGQGYFKRKEEV